MSCLSMASSRLTTLMTRFSFEEMNPLARPCTFQLDANVYQNKTYQPPELCYSGKDLDEKIDIYALGGILYGILTRARPYNDLRGNYTELKRRKQLGIMPSFAKVEGKHNEM